jgi:hypothetical protein
MDLVQLDWFVRGKRLSEGTIVNEISLVLAVGCELLRSVSRPVQCKVKNLLPHVGDNAVAGKAILLYR